MSIRGRQAPLQDPCLCAAGQSRAPTPLFCPQATTPHRWHLWRKPEQPQGSDEGEGRMSQVATRGQWGARSGRSQRQGKLLWVPVTRDFTSPAAGRQGPRQVGGKAPDRWCQCTAHLGRVRPTLFALGTSQGCILAFERGESGKHCTTSSPRKIVYTPIPLAWILLVLLSCSPTSERQASLPDSQKFPFGELPRAA